MVSVYVRRSQSRQDTSAHISEQQVNSADAPIAHTECAYEQHIKRAALATAIDKSAHICNSNVEPREDYGWTVDNGYLMPVQSTHQALPQEMKHTIPCGCTKGCSRNCSCAKKNIACTLGCRCQGSKKCGRARYTDAFDNISDSDSDN